MRLVYRSRIILINFAKLFPFCLCLLVFTSLSESLYALLSSDYVLYDGSIIPNTPLSWAIGRIYEIGLRSLLLASGLSISFQTCIWNKLCIIYLGIYLWIKHYLSSIELEITTIYLIIIFNIMICCFLIYKGLYNSIKSNN